jgi:hypothetical protein
MGIGRKLTPEAFVNACDVFVHVENLEQPKKAAKPEKVATEKSTKNGKELMNLLQRAFDIAAQDDGWVHLGALGEALHRLEPSFDSRTYGHKTLSQLVKSLPDQLIVKGAKKTGPSVIFVRMKDS